MKGRAPTKDEKQFMDDMAQLGCIVCRNMNIYTPQVSLHHMEGRVKKGCHYKVLPLCASHHQIADIRKPKAWVSRHGDGKKAFEDAYGTELELYKQCIGLLEINRKRTSII